MPAEDRLRVMRRLLSSVMRALVLYAADHHDREAELAAGVARTIGTILEIDEEAAARDRDRRDREP